MFKFVLDKAIKSSFDGIIHPFFVLIQEEGCSTKETTFLKKLLLK